MDKLIPIIRHQAKRLLRFIRAGWFWILLPLIIVLVIILILLIFGDPAQSGALSLRYILLYSLF